MDPDPELKKFKAGSRSGINQSGSAALHLSVEVDAVIQNILNPKSGETGLRVHAPGANKKKEREKNIILFWTNSVLNVGSFFRSAKCYGSIKNPI